MTVAIDFCGMEKKYYGSQWLPSTKDGILKIIHNLAVDSSHWLT